MSLTPKRSGWLELGSNCLTEPRPTLRPKPGIKGAIQTVLCCAGLEIGGAAAGQIRSPDSWSSCR